jgi:hypothetical protein
MATKGGTSGEGREGAAPPKPGGREGAAAPKPAGREGAAPPKKNSFSSTSWLITLSHS